MSITVNITGETGMEVVAQMHQLLAASIDTVHVDTAPAKTEKKAKKESAAQPSAAPAELPSAPATQSAVAADPTPEPAAVEQAEKGEELTIEKVRAVLTELSQNGKKAQVKQLLTKFSVERVTELKPDQFAAVMAEAEKLN